MAHSEPRRRGGIVVRISRTRETTHAVTLKVEGALVADWVPVLADACVSHLDQRKTVELDFGDVSFIDRQAVGAVRQLIAKGVTILHPTPLVRDLLDEHLP
jgi:ABC-type transporter Mla MlaB component